MSGTGGDVEGPAGWEETTLGRIGLYHNGRGFKKVEWSACGRPIIRIQNLTSPEKPFNHFEGEVHDRHVVRPGDILISWAATLDVFRWSGPEAVLNQHIFKVESFIDAAFHYYVLKAVLDDLRRQAHGTGMVHITRDRFLDTSVLLPPLQEQQRIVDELDRQLGRIEEARDELEYARALLGRYMSACRVAAFNGSLIGHDAPPERPLDEVAEIQSGIAKGKPKNPEAVDTPYISTANVQAGYLDLIEIKTLPATPKQQERHRLAPGDVLVLEGGDADKVGRGWIWEGQRDDCVHQNHVFAVRPRGDMLLPRYLAHYICSPHARRYFLSCAKQTTNLASINKTQLRELPLPVPDLADQQAAVNALEDKLSTATELYGALSAAVIETEGLRRSVLHQAMRGRLVRQDAADEPAKLLLTRLATTQEDSRQRPRSKAIRAVPVGR
jgi:type I restriction enzyme S subunit